MSPKEVIVMQPGRLPMVSGGGGKVGVGVEVVVETLEWKKKYYHIG